MWRELIASLSTEFDFSNPADGEILCSAESSLGQPIPEELKSFLFESDGVSDGFGCDFIWPVGEIVRRNREMRGTVEFRQLYMPFDSLLFFGDSGSGDLFAFIVSPPCRDIFVWQHENDSRCWVANGLRDFVTRYLSAGGEGWYSI
ncbi:SMI1/KNR4 family protein [Streptomyces ferrugineus]|uniref:SMI1/KNR4 family protein n=1 Tax=Streptomyces ferrugineus TaxID=1413221 RepID=A0A7M2SKD2_9ACTN|nr:SMI1/KNR4 family protein [Streptomyces ferrugineus]QOV35923.1 SMI1/KNR4 family protein [Streptomyces ferrugineus]